MANLRRHPFTLASARVGAAGLLALTAGAVLVGCGGGSGPTAASYDRQASAICHRYDKQVKSLASNSSQTQAEHWISRTYGILQTVTAKIDKLEVPSGHTTIDAAKGDQHKAVADLASVLKSVRAGDVSAFEQELTTFEKDVGDAATAWSKAGVKACGQ